MPPPAQREAWAAAARYLNGRIQSTPEQKPGRTPDLKPAAAKAMIEVLNEVGSGAPCGPPQRHPAWAPLYEQLEMCMSGQGNTQADGAAGMHSHHAREEAAKRLIMNHDAAHDVTNPAPKTQQELKRVPVDAREHVDRALREVARRRRSALCRAAA